MNHKLTEISVSFFYLYTMNKFTFLFSFLVVIGVQAQFNVSIEDPSKLKINEAILYTLDGSKDILSSKELKRNNHWIFNVPKTYHGMIKIYFPEINYSINAISENKNVKMKLHGTVNKISEVTYLDESNILMEKNQDLQHKKEFIFPALAEIKAFYTENSDFGIALSKEINRLGEEVEVNPEKHPFINYYKTNYDKYVVKNSAGNNATQNEMIQFLSNTNEMLESSSLIRPILVNYLNKATNSNVEDSVDKLLQAVNVETPRGQTILSELIEIFEVFGMGNLKEKYLTEAKKLKCTINDRLSSTITANKNVELGATFPDIKFSNVLNTNQKNLHSVKSDKKVIVFWASTCSHCENDLPILHQKYSEMKSNNIEIVGFSLDTDKNSYNKIATALPWINTTELKGWYSSSVEIYNIHATPTYFVLDSNNKIIAKPDKASDVLQFLKMK